MMKSAHILIGDPDARAGESLAAALSAYGFQARAEHDPEALLTRASERRPDVTLLGGFGLPDPTIELARALKTGRRTAGLPVVLTRGGDAETCRRALAAGIDDILPENAETADIAGRLPRLVRSAVMQAELHLRVATAREFGVAVDPDAFARTDPGPATTLAVCADGAALSALRRKLEDAGFRVAPERAHDRAAERLEEESVDAVVVFLAGDEDSDAAAALCARIRANHRLYNLPVLVAAPALAAARRHALYNAGAGLVLEEGADGGEMLGIHLRMLVNRQHLRRALHEPLVATRAAGTADPDLPGVYGAPFLDTHLARHLRRATARDGDLSLGLVDVREGVADAAAAHGAEAAGLLWPRVADWIAGITRIEDTLARRADGTFAVILPDTPVAEARLVLDRISGILEQSEFHLTAEVMAPVHVWPRTAVAGRASGDDAAALLARAESALG